MDLVASGNGSYKQDLSSRLSFPCEDGLICLSEESQGLLRPDSSPRREQGSRCPPPSSMHISSSKGRPGVIGAILEGVWLRTHWRNTKCRAGGQTVFKCFKMQITTGFEFSLPPLVKTKVEVGLPKSHRAAACFFGAQPSRHQLRKGMESLMAASQIDRASWAVGGADTGATRTGSPKAGQEGRAAGTRRPRWQGGRLSGNQALHPKGLRKAKGRATRWLMISPVMVSWGKEAARQRPGSGWGGRTHPSTRWPVLSKFWRDRDCQKQKFPCVGAQKWLLGQEMPSVCSAPSEFFGFPLS